MIKYRQNEESNLILQNLDQNKTTNTVAIVVIATSELNNHRALLLGATRVDKTKILVARGNKRMRNTKIIPKVDNE